MKTTFHFLLVLLACIILAGAAEEKPFQLSIVPESRTENSSSISLAKDSQRKFYVVLTNTTDKAQPVFEAWNSWGYQTVSFELILPSGERAKLSVKSQAFKRNFASTYVIPPKGHQVFPITLNDKWDVKFDFGSLGQTKIKLTAIYEVLTTKEAVEKKVWTGRIVSETINTEVNHW
jgi:hypothetical protein